MSESYQAYSNYRTERDKQIRAWILENIKPAEIARRLGVSRQRAYQLCQRLSGGGGLEG